MNRRSSCFAAAVALLCATGTVAAPQSVPIYDSTEIALDSYTVMKRMGVSDWRSAFGIGGYSDEAHAREALIVQAAQLGADGVINLHCLGQTDRVFKPTGYYCYGNAIKLRPARSAP